MNEEIFLTIRKKSTGLYKEKGSRFLSFAFPVSSESQIKEILQNLRSKYHDAKHCCYAYVIGPEGDTTRANDDGEPSHSAGDPILRQIKSRKLTNILVVIVRYFGGIKLGVSGLINAYKSAALDAIENNIIIEKARIEEFKINFEYHSTKEVMKLVEDLHLKIISQSYAMECQLMVGVKIKYIEVFISRLNMLKQTGHKLSFSPL